MLRLGLALASTLHRRRRRRRRRHCRRHRQSTYSDAWQEAHDGTHHLETQTLYDGAHLNVRWLRIVGYEREDGAPVGLEWACTSRRRISLD